MESYEEKREEKRKTILVVDDEIAWVDMLCIILKHEDYTVVSATDSESGSVAHSLKNEFLNIGASIKGIRELANGSSDIQEECNMIERSVEYSQLHLQRLLDYLDMGKPPVEPIDVLELLRRTELLARPRLSSSVQLETTIDPNVKGRTVSANLEQLMGVLLELINNATNALREKGGTIGLHLEDRNGKLAISVKDDGPGIPEARNWNFLSRS